MNNRYFDNTLDINNPAPRCPVILLLDTSGSMSGTPICELNEGYRQFLRETMNDEAASMSVELEVVTFGGTVNVQQPFASINTLSPRPAEFTASGGTPMGEALRLAMRNLEARRQKYKDNGIAAYRPWVVLMSDGQPTDTTGWEETVTNFRSLVRKEKINCVGVGIGSGVDMNTLKRVAPGALPLQGLKFKQFFRWLTDSLGAVSASAVSDQDNIQFGDVGVWADLNKMCR